MAYLRVSKDSKYSFLLESVINGENVARYSFIGAGERYFKLTFRMIDSVPNIRSLQDHKDWSRGGIDW